MTEPEANLATVRRLARECGFREIGVAAMDLEADAAHLDRWLAAGRHGGMAYMARHPRLRSRPRELVPGTASVISVRLDYWPADATPADQVLADARLAYVSRYALGRDYHRVLRARIARLARRIAETFGLPAGRAYVDSGPLLEKALARNAGLGAIGKHSNLLTESGSWFVLGELLTPLELPVATRRVADLCGGCTSCLRACPTQAITGPREVDARLCISYLTIEHHGPIPEPLRPLVGNRIFGCDDCQLVCPWNAHDAPTGDPAFAARRGLDATPIAEMAAWSEGEFLARSEGGPLRRLDHARFLRNVAVALGNAPAEAGTRAAAARLCRHPDPVVAEHARWARDRLA